MGFQPNSISSQVLKPWPSNRYSKEAHFEAFKDFSRRLQLQTEKPGKMVQYILIGNNEPAQQIKDTQFVRDLQAISDSTDTDLPNVKANKIWEAFSKSIEHMKSVSKYPLMETLLKQGPSILPKIAQDYDQMIKDHATVALWNKLDFSNKPELTKPDEIRQWMKKNPAVFRNIKDLDLSNTSLKVIPDEITYLTDLTKLNLSNNQFDKLPAECKVPSSLRHLDFSNNQIQEIPSEIKGLSDLALLDLGYNWIEKTPAQIDGLPHLRILKVHNNLITKAAQIRKLDELLILFLNNNQIHSINPAEFGDLTKDLALVLRGAPIIIFPERIYCKSFKLTLIGEDETKIYKNELTYKPKSRLASLYGCIVREFLQTVQNMAFEALSKEDKLYIYAAHAEMSLMQKTPQDINLTKLNFFDGKDLFMRLVRQGILDKFAGLNPAEKTKTYIKVHELAGRPKGDPAKWGEENALLCLQRLADAMPVRPEHKA